MCLPGGKVWDAAFKEQLLAEACLLQGRGEINLPAQTHPWAAGELTQFWPHESPFWYVVHDHMEIKIFKNNIWCWGRQSVCAQSLGCYAGAWFSSSWELCAFWRYGSERVWHAQQSKPNQEPKYVKILKSGYFLTSSRPSFHTKFRLQKSVVSCVSPYGSLGSGNWGGNCAQPRYWLAPIRNNWWVERRKKKFKKKGGGEKKQT